MKNTTLNRSKTMQTGFYWVFIPNICQPVWQVGQYNTQQGSEQ